MVGIVVEIVAGTTQQRLGMLPVVVVHDDGAPIATLGVMPRMLESSRRGRRGMRKGEQAVV